MAILAHGGFRNKPTRVANAKVAGFTPGVNRE
jgi:hypothetical protein